MKAQDIKNGTYYYDGKAGIRLVLDSNPVSGFVTYRVIAALKEQRFDHETGSMQAVIGREERVLLASFASWAKSSYDATSIVEIQSRLAAKKARLSPGEKSFLMKIAVYGFRTATGFAFEPYDGRAVSGLERKGMVTRSGNRAHLTSTGSEWIAQQAS